MTKVEEFQQRMYDAGRYGEIASKVDLLMRVSERPCRGGECDLDAPCDRHQNTHEIAQRYARMKGMIW